MKNLRIQFVIMLALALATTTFAQQRHYLTFGRNPMIPGGLTVEQARERGLVPFQLEIDTYFTMRGASGELVSGWAPQGLLMGERPDGSCLALICGNETNYRRPKKIAPPPPKVTQKPAPAPPREERLPPPPPPTENHMTMTNTIYMGDTNVNVTPGGGGAVAERPLPRATIIVGHGGGEGVSLSYTQGSKFSNKNVAFGGNGAAAAAAAAVGVAAAVTPTSAAVGTQGATSGASSGGNNNQNQGRAAPRRPVRVRT